MTQTTTTWTAEAWHNNGHPSGFKINGKLETPDQAKAFVAQLPKSLGARAGTWRSTDELDVVRGWVHIHAFLSPNGTTGARNETGIRRYHNTIRHLQRLGVEPEWTAKVSNSYPTQADYERAIA